MTEDRAGSAVELAGAVPNETARQSPAAGVGRTNDPGRAIIRLTSSCHCCTCYLFYIPPELRSSFDQTLDLDLDQAELLGRMRMGWAGKDG